MTAILRTRTVVPRPDGDLRAGVWGDGRPGPVPGLVMVDGSGDGAYDDWGDWPDRLVDCGAVVLTHDKPGCGSPGDWLAQSFTDRAQETLAALAVLRAQPETAGAPVGLYGVSQGGWVALLAATLATAECPVDFVVTASGPGVGVAAQDRTRIERDLRTAGLPPEPVDAALAWLDERTERLLAGEPVPDVLAAQGRYADASWYPLATRYFDNPVALGFLARNLDFDPAPVLAQLRCPVLALFGGADTLVPVPQSVSAFATHLPALPGDPHGLAVFAGADHGLFIADPDPAVRRTDQLAPGFLPMLAGFLAARRPDAAVRHGQPVSA